MADSLVLFSACSRGSGLTFQIMIGHIMKQVIYLRPFTVVLCMGGKEQ